MKKHFPLEDLYLCDHPNPPWWWWWWPSPSSWIGVLPRPIVHLSIKTIAITKCSRIIFTPTTTLIIIYNDILTHHKLLSTLIILLCNLLWTFCFFTVTGFNIFVRSLSSVLRAASSAFSSQLMILLRMQSILGTH